jgi:hypothetical protein
MPAVPAAVVLALAALPTAWNSADVKHSSINMQFDNNDGICTIGLPRDEDSQKLQIKIRASDGKMNVVVDDVPGDWVDEDKEIQLTLTPSSGNQITTATGGYIAGFTYRAYGLFGAVDDGLALLSMLDGTDSVKVSFDGHDDGTFVIQQTGDLKNFAYDYMQDCMEKNGGSTDF